MTITAAIFVFLGILLITFLSHAYLFSIYEVTISEVPKELAVGDTVTITVTPINALGFKPPFRSCPFEVSVIKGDKLLQKIEPGKYLATSPGEVELLIKPKYALKPSPVSFLIR
jgi:hypothetical protein